MRARGGCRVRAPPRRSIELRTVAIWEPTQGEQLATRLKPTGAGAGAGRSPVGQLRPRGSAEMQPLLTAE